jgi:sugar O-acyltransferase (sialic acid O-acetyltransferase NeuD family)|tara:strand:+ start:234 stop:914 length:681 start_codon:yes stop_codon:yes gene_type:complete
MIQKISIKKIIIIGTGGFGREVLWTIKDCNKQSKKYEILGFIDDNRTLVNTKIENLPVLGTTDWILSNSKIDISYVIGIGDCKSRENIINKLKNKNIRFETIIHPSVIKSESVKIGEGSIIQAGCILTINVVIGKHVHVNIKSTIGHDCVIKDFVTINPGVHVNGGISIGKGSFIGSGVIMKDEIKIGNESVIGAGTVLIKDVPESSLVVGNPGKIKKKDKNKKTN